MNEDYTALLISILARLEARQLVLASILIKPDSDEIQRLFSSKVDSEHYSLLLYYSDLVSDEALRQAILSYVPKEA